MVCKRRLDRDVIGSTHCKVTDQRIKRR